MRIATDHNDIHKHSNHLGTATIQTWILATTGNAWRRRQPHNLLVTTVSGTIVSMPRDHHKQNHDS